MVEVVALIKALGLSPVCALILAGAGALLWDRRRLVGRISDLVDRQLDDMTRRAALWENSRKDAEQ